MNAWQEDVRLSNLTNIGLGGPARFFTVVESEAQLKMALQKAAADSLRVHILGGGSNTVFSDDGFDGLVIKADLRGLQFEEEPGFVSVSAGAGENWDRLVAEAVRRDFAGLECMSGIPGLVGATPMQNVGAYGQQVSDVITSVKALNRKTLKEKIFSKEECGFRYRDSFFKSGPARHFVILAVTYRLRKGGAPTVKYPQIKEIIGAEPSLAEVREAVLDLRRRKSMVVDTSDPHSRSCGSFFVNPVITDENLKDVRKRYQELGGSEEVPVFRESGKIKIPAAWLVEQAGFAKGTRRGRVGISPNHALGLVNYNGTTKELLALAAEIQAGVKERFGVELEIEPVLVS